MQNCLTWDIIASVAATTRRIRALLKLASASEVASAFRVSIRAVRAWEKKGVPLDLVDRVDLALKAGRERKKAFTKAVSRGTPKGIALAYGVSVATARRWMKQGIPLKAFSHVPLLESVAEREAKPRTLKTTIRHFKGKLGRVRGVAHEAVVNAWLTPSLIRMLAEWYSSRIDALQASGKSYQCQALGDGPEELTAQAADQGFRAYNVIILQGDGERGKRGDVDSMLLSSRAYKRLSDASRDIVGQLLEAADVGFFCKAVRVFVRRPV